MKRIYTILMIFIMTLAVNIFLMEDVFASSATISVSPSSSRVVVGEQVRVTITVSSSQPLGSWEFDVQYDTSKLTLVSSTLEASNRSVTNVSNSNTRSRTYTMTFKANSSGTANVRVVNARVVGYNFSDFTVTRGSTNIKIQTQAEVNTAKSSNNNLASLSITGHELTPVFSASTLEYAIELENDVRSITVNATLADRRATLKGTGTHSLKEGENKIEVAVTAENGNRKIYVINAIVKELNPIVVNIGESEYTVVRKLEELETPATYVSITTLINGEEVPAFESSITGFQLVALRDSDGNVNFYINRGNENFDLYVEHRFKATTLFIIDAPTSRIPKGYTAATSMFDDMEIIMYKAGIEFYPLIYGIDVETGEEGFYTYDEKEQTLQRFNGAVMVREKIVEEDNELLVITLGVISFISLLGLIMVGAKKKRKEG